jgi:hypothetical protein
VVEEVVDAGLEGVGVEQPAAEGDLDAELMLFVALAVEGREVGVVGLRELHDGAGGGEEGRGLVEAAVEATEDPVQFGDEDGGADAGGGYVFGDGCLEVRLAEAGDEGEPGGGFEVVGEILLDDAAGRLVGDAEVGVAAVIVEDCAEEVGVVLAEGVDAGLEGVARDGRGDGGLGAGVVGGAVGGGGYWGVVGVGFVVGAVVVVEGRDLQDGGQVEGVEPGEGGKAVGLVLAGAEAAGVELLVLDAVGVGVVGDLEVVVAELGDEA